MRKKLHTDLVVVGAGVAGLTAALTAADAGASVRVVAKGGLDSSNSWAAQGGVAAAVGPDDDPALHAADTLAAGRGLCRESAVDLLTREAPARIADLVALGVEFDEGLAREGGHSRSRVVHAGGAETGRLIAEVLGRRVREHPRIAIVEGERVTSLSSLDARSVVLATGGYAALWERTPPAFIDPDFWGKLATILIVNHTPGHDHPRLSAMFKDSCAWHQSMRLDADVCQQMAFNRVAEEVEKIVGMRMAVHFSPEGPVRIEVFPIYTSSRKPAARTIRTTEAAEPQTQSVLYAVHSPER